MDDRIATARALMDRFAERTGLASDRPPRRYLWTDAFAVCNFLGLAAATGDARHAELATRLVEQVHAVLGRHRPDEARAGWLSGRGPQEGAAHPTCAGLRIGKPLPERAVEEPFDERLEWDRDGQYFHYLTKWMHALDRVARATGRPTFNVWARELAVAAHGAFVHVVPGAATKRMYWKMSIDLSRPQVASMGHHDALDGLVTCRTLAATAARLGGQGAGPDLGPIAADFAAMVDRQRLATDDPLGIGGLLLDAHEIVRLGREGAWPDDDALPAALLDAAAMGVRAYVRRPDLRAPAAYRLAFRELGLAIGLAAAERLAADAALPDAARAAGAALAAQAPVRTAIESCWLTPEHRRAASWLEHEDINDVMLATALVPEGVLTTG